MILVGEKTKSRGGGGAGKKLKKTARSAGTHHGRKGDVIRRCSKHPMATFRVKKNRERGKTIDTSRERKSGEDSGDGAQETALRLNLEGTIQPPPRITRLAGKELSLLTITCGGEKGKREKYPVEQAQSQRRSRSVPFSRGKGGAALNRPPLLRGRIQKEGKGYKSVEATSPVNVKRRELAGGGGCRRHWGGQGEA